MSRMNHRVSNSSPYPVGPVEAPDNGQSFYLAKSTKVFKHTKKSWHVRKTDFCLTMSASMALRLMQKHTNIISTGSLPLVLGKTKHIIAMLRN